MARRILLFSLLLASLCPPVAASAGTLTATTYGVLDLGDTVAYRVEGPDCEGAQVHVRIIAGVTAAEVVGPDSSPLQDGTDPTGCTGIATVPGYQDVREAGWRQGDPIAIDLVSGAQTVPMRSMRTEADRFPAAAGTPHVVAANDPDTGAWDNAIEMAPGDAIALGRADLQRADSISLRICVPTGIEQSTIDQLFERRHEAPVYLSVHQDSVSGPLLLGPTSVAANMFTDSRLDTHGFGGGCWRLLPLPFTHKPVENAPSLFLVIEQLSVGTILLNSIDINGTGAKVAGAHGEDPPGMTTIFDGNSFDGWTQSMCVLRDGAVTNSDPFPLRGCSITYSAEKVHNMVLRFHIRRESFFDNGAIYVPSEVQVRSAGEYLPGGYFGEYAARAEKFNVFPDWSEMEIIQLGARYVVTLNGRTVTDHVADGGDPVPFNIRFQAQPEWSYRYGAAGSFGSEEPVLVTPADWGHVWWDNVRLYHCASVDDPVCTSLANARLGQAAQG